MNLATISGLYENARRVNRVLSTPNNTIPQLKQRLASLNDVQVFELAMALDALESHTRVLGLEEFAMKVDAR